MNAKVNAMTFLLKLKKIKHNRCYIRFADKNTHREKKSMSKRDVQDILFSIKILPGTHRA